MCVCVVYKNEQMYTSAAPAQLCGLTAPALTHTIPFNGMTCTTLRASLMRHQRPSRCSWPMAATRKRPSAVNSRLFTKPVCACGR